MGHCKRSAISTAASLSASGKCSGLRAGTGFNDPGSFFGPVALCSHADFG